MPYLLNLVYAILIAVAFPYLLYCRVRQGKYRDGWRQKLWGGYTCPKCACEMDKWGRRLAQ